MPVGGGGGVNRAIFSARCDLHYPHPRAFCTLEARPTQRSTSSISRKNRGL